jgi:sigma-E factor negative regulatory protein RseB
VSYRLHTSLLSNLSFAVLLIFSVGATGSDCPDVDAAAVSWLDKMSRSMHQESYHGVVTLRRGEDMQVMQVSHSVHDDSTSERLVELTGQGAQIERAAHPLNCIHPGDQLLRLGALLEGGECGIAEQYRVSVDGGERVAGRNAVRIKVEPRDMYRFGYIMDLDRETGLLLKIQTIGHGRQVLETLQFANISYAESVPGVSDSVEVIHDARHSNPDIPTGSLPVGRAWSVGWLPRGFAPTDQTLAVSGRRSYTDGLAVFSVFLEDLVREIRPGEGLVRNGGTTSYTRGMSLSGQPVLVTVIGEVPVNAARMVADSIGWEQ